MSAQPRESPASDAGALWQDPRLAGWLPAALPLIERLPALDDAARWVSARVGGQLRQFAQPITFTPYASVRPCSARCRFCSENLRPVGDQPAAAQLRPGPGYFDGLAQALRSLRPVTLSWSLSGLEISDEPDWMLRLLDQLRAAERAGQPVQERVMYSNAAGLFGPRGGELVSALQGFGLTRLELSRHHHEAGRNQAIMRFRDAATLGSAAFDDALPALAAQLPLTLVCVVQRGGVESVADLRRYLEWAWRCGARSVVFRELARLDGEYRDNATARYLQQARVDVAALAAAALAAGTHGLHAVAATRGYYFSNLRCRDEAGREVVFEAADYAAMHRRHDSARVYKLIYFAHGELGADWQPGRAVLWRVGDG